MTRNTPPVRHASTSYFNILLKNKAHSNHACLNKNLLNKTIRYVICLSASIIAPVSFAATPGVSIDEQRQYRSATDTGQNLSQRQSFLGSQYGTSTNTLSNGGLTEDRLSQLIKEKQTENGYQSESLTIQQNTRIRPAGTQTNSYGQGVVFDNLAFERWINMSTYRANQVSEYQRYLAQYVGLRNVPPMEQLLSTARSWNRCGYEQFQIPPAELWSNMIMTLRLYSTLKNNGILPQTSEIRSVYRNPGLNACAGGAASSKHMTNGAIDIWVPEYEDQPWLLNPLHNRLCQFWSSQGEGYNFGLGLYATGAIHLDTQGYRMWGERYTAPNSICQYVDD